jgi:hypothetical protein
MLGNVAARHHHSRAALARPIGHTRLVLLCTRHHTMIHHGDWSISMVDGFPLFHPPPWVGHQHLRNLIHRPDLISRRWRGSTTSSRAVLPRR